MKFLRMASVAVALAAAGTPGITPARAACNEADASSKSQKTTKQAIDDCTKAFRAASPTSEQAFVALETRARAASTLSEILAEEIDLARKEAMLAGRDADVIKYCEMQGVAEGKSDPQVLLGCALAACRSNQVDKARAWSKSLPKPLRRQAVEICQANKVIL